MALSYPIALDDFFAGLGIVSVEFHPVVASAEAMTIGGDVVRSGYGAHLWRGKVAIRRHYNADMHAIQAKVEHMLNPAASFYVSPVKQHLRNDPSGVFTGSDTATIATLDSPTFTVAGLSVTLSDGDMIEIAGREGPRLHSVVRFDDTLVLNPPPDITVSVGNAVTVNTPKIAAAMVKGSYQWPVYAPVITGGPSFEWVEWRGASA